MPIEHAIIYSYVIIGLACAILTQDGMKEIHERTILSKTISLAEARVGVFMMVFFLWPLIYLNIFIQSLTRKE